MPATDDIDNADQAYLAYSFHPHHALRIHLPFLVRVGERGPSWLDEVMVGRISACQSGMLKQPCELCATRKWVICEACIGLEGR
jgi:hypothetical protein